MNLGAAIKVVRKSRHLMQIELANLCGVTVSYISLIENNKKEPSLPVLRSIGEALRVPVPVLMFLAMEVNEVPPHRREAFMMILPAAQTMIRGMWDLK